MRMFVVGDIHGCYDELMAKLDEVGFNKEEDKLFALGDLIDRGPKNEEVLELLKEDWFTSIKGNHEDLMLNNDAYLHSINGGNWFINKSSEEKQYYINLVKDLPWFMVVVTPSGKRIGLVHADVYGTNDWNEFVSCYRNEYAAMWSRERVRLEISRDKINLTNPDIIGVDHVYFGHTPLRNPITIGNKSWIDTGCFATGTLTIVELV